MIVDKKIPGKISSIKAKISNNKQKIRKNRQFWGLIFFPRIFFSHFDKLESLKTIWNTLLNVKIESGILFS